MQGLMGANGSTWMQGTNTLQWETATWSERMLHPMVPSVQGGTKTPSLNKTSGLHLRSNPPPPPLFLSRPLDEPLRAKDFPPLPPLLVAASNLGGRHCAVHLEHKKEPQHKYGYRSHS